jgi:hypothetical protein
MKGLLLYILLICSHICLSQNNCRYCNSDESCLKLIKSKIINVCAVEDDCLVISKGKIINSCMIPEKCLQLDGSKVISTCGVNSDCLYIRDSRVYNSCKVEDTCLRIEKNRILNDCAIIDSCIKIDSSKIVNICGVLDSCIKIVHAKLVNLCTIQDSCLEAVKRKISNACSTCESYANETLLVYDAKTKKFFYNIPSKGILPLSDLNDFKLKYKTPFRFEIINLNRYLYNVNLSNSDVAFTSSESAVMQQYLIAGSTNGQIQPANTYAAGASGNQGDIIISYIPGFKSSIDKITGVIADANSSTKAINKSIVNLSKTLSLKAKQSRLLLSRAPGTSALNNFLSSQNKYILQFSGLQSKIASMNSNSQANQLYNKEYIPKANAYADTLNKILDSLDTYKTENFATAENKATINDLRSETSNLKSLVSSRSGLPENNCACDTTSTDTLITQTGKDLKSAFDSLEKYYNHYLDNKIVAYSICTDSFNCCGINANIYTYSYFDSLLTNISESYGIFKKAVKAIPPAAAPEEPKKIIITATSAEINYANNRITGIKLNQPLDTAKPKPPIVDDKATAIKALDTLWYAFEKSISPDFILRQILFNRNMVAENMKYVSPPIFPYGDRMGLIFQIIASDSAKKNGVILDHTTTESLDFMVTGKPLFSFSAGTFVGIGNSLKSPGYAFQQVPPPGSNTVQAASPYQLAQTGAGSSPIGIDGMANITKRIPGKNKSDWHYGLSVGVGTVLTPSLQIAYLAGITGSVGTYQQFHFTLGAIGMNVNELKSNYVNNNVLYSTSPGTDIYNQKIKFGAFFSVSYTIFTPKGTGPTQIATNSTSATK